MDALALLCNLYGDGPATLERLRHAGCGSVEVLQRFEEDELARILSIQLAAARRLRAEAENLMRRLREPLFGDAEEEAPQPSGEAATGDGGSQPAGSSSARGPSGEDDLLRQVLDAWRERDRSVRPSGDEETPEGVPVPSEDPSLVGEPAETPLRAGLLDGLDLELVARLRQIGVETAEELAEGEPLGIAQAIDVALTRVMRVQFLARRFLATRAGPPAAPAGVLWPAQREARAPRASGGRERFSAAEPLAEGAPLGLPLSMEDDLRKFSQRRSQADRAGASGPFA